MTAEEVAAAAPPPGPAVQAPGTANTISEEEVSALLESGAVHSVRPYDFAAVRINRTRLPMLEVVSKSFADRLGSTLTALIGRDVSVQFTALDSAKAGDLQAALPVPACLVTVRLKPLPGQAFIVVDPTLLLALLDGFFGGSGRPITDLQAAIAPAALRFLTLLLRSQAADVTAAWAPVTPIELEFVKQETNPRLMQLGTPQELMMVLKFTVEFGAHSGRIDWLIPEGMLAGIREVLASESGTVPVQKQEVWAPQLGMALLETEMETRAILAQAEISLRELVRLSPGDIIPIEAPQEVLFLVGEVPLYRGRFGVSQGHNSLKILPGGLV